MHIGLIILEFVTATGLIGAVAYIVRIEMSVKALKDRVDNLEKIAEKQSDIAANVIRLDEKASYIHDSVKEIKEVLISRRQNSTN